MKNTIIALFTVLSATVAQADGFNCTTESGLKIKVYNHTSADEGTRTAATMVISDSTVGAGNKTIARFTDVNGTLESDSQVYTADVDLRFNDSERKGELIGGTKLGQLDQIKLYVDFSYAAPLEHGDDAAALLVLIKRNGQRLTEDVVCRRYLKN